MTTPVGEATMGSYIVYGGELSYFTRKLEAAMRFYGADFELRGKTPDVREEIERRAGTHQVPVLHTPENWMIADTTPLMMMLDGRFPRRRMFPAGALGVLVHVVEEYFDEWIARTMVHYRWHYEESTRFASLRMAGGDEAAAARVAEWGPRACRATGTESEIQQRAAEAEYVRILEAAEAQLGQSRYLMGDRPTAVDCIVLGGLRAHTNMDPDPKKITAGYPRVVAWSEADADAWEGGGELAPFPESTEFARFVLDEMVDTYKPYLLANRKALAAGAKAFHAIVYDEDVSYLSRPYPPFSSTLITSRIQDQLTESERAEVSEWLQGTGLAECFLEA
ncbi:MAG: glutathione S-transferase family protein [Gammaproteobacteria bacterium]